MKMRFLFFLLPFLMGSFSEAKCVHIYYDRVEGETQAFGRIYATYLQNFLGHFPHIQQIVSPASLYVKGELEKCDANFYLGSNFEAPLPQEFLADVVTTSKPFMWMGYGWWRQSVDAQDFLLGFHYEKLTTIDKDNLDARGLPGFFSQISYKGEIFQKWNKLNLAGQYVVPFEMTALKPSETAAQGEVLAEARHSSKGETLPYIVRKGDFFFVADIPFSFIHESDRAMVLADVLFDVLKEQPRHQKKPALLRIEDVHPLSPVHELYNLTHVLEQEKVPVVISLIPFFFDPLFGYERSKNQEFVRISDVPEFVAFLKSAQSKKASFIWHGVTHQYGRVRNPHSGYTSDDFEFWDAVNNRPITEDSPGYVLRRLESGFGELQKYGITPQIWLTPHYQASSQDYQVFARVFPWNIGRVIYFLNETKGLPESVPQSLWYRPGSSAQAREDFFSKLQVQTNGQWFGQLYPYEIYGDVYGQRLLPENLGNPQPFKSEHVWYPRTIDQILEDARRNRVLRDVWASAFIHPYLLTSGTHDGIGHFPGDPEKLRKLVHGLRDLGYEFIDADQFARDNQTTLRPTPIERR